MSPKGLRAQGATEAGPNRCQGEGCTCTGSFLHYDLPGQSSQLGQLRRRRSASQGRHATCRSPVPAHGPGRAVVKAKAAPTTALGGGNHGASGEMDGSTHASTISANPAPVPVVPVVSAGPAGPPPPEPPSSISPASVSTPLPMHSPPSSTEHHLANCTSWNGCAAELVHAG